MSYPRKKESRIFLNSNSRTFSWITPFHIYVKTWFISFVMSTFFKASLIMVCMCSPAYGQNKLASQDFNLFDKPANKMMRNYLTALVDRQFEARDSLLSTFETAKDWDRRAQMIRDSLAAWTGPFPDRTPLHVRVTGKIERKQYTIEKIIFDSRPDFPVSANLYLPKNAAFPRPAILNVIGHTLKGKSSHSVQMRSIDQVKKGFVVLTIDAIGQGERRLSDYGKDSPTQAHKVIGIQAFLSGTHLFNFMAWDVIRAMDYLGSRPEVDTTKISITGTSGGGMMSTYILPFEDRIVVAVPACNPNTWSYRVHANLATDHEQVFPGAFASMIDPRGAPFFVFASSKKPLLLNTTTDDPLNPPRGVWALSSWLFRAYSTYGDPEKFTTSMVHAGHGYNREQREVTNAWMLRWSGGDASKFRENKENAALVEKQQSLWASPAGNVYDLPGSRKPHQLVIDYLKKHQPRWGPLQTPHELSDRKAKVKKLVKSTLDINITHATVKGTFKHARQVGPVKIRKFMLKPERGIVLPGVLLTSQTKDSNHNAILYISQNGKSDILNDMDIIKPLLNAGYLVCAIDLRGIGETAPAMQNKLWDILAGEPIFGQRVRDVLAAIKWLKELESKAQNIKLWGKGMGALYGAFAGVLSNDISEFILENPLLSFANVVQTKVPKYANEVLLPNILEKFDMPQIYQALCPKPVTIINPFTANKRVADSVAMGKEYKVVLEAYKSVDKRSHWNPQVVTLKSKSDLVLEALLSNEK